MSRYLYKKIQNISPESLNFQHSGLKLTTLGSDPNIQKYDIPELQTFINGIKKDLTAVKNGIIYSYNNGLAEGSVNKIKVIKRVMYGRNSFELLKAKVLFGELFHVKRV